MWASRQGSLSAMKLLLQAASDAASVDDEGRTACMWAARCGALDAVRALLLAGEDLRRQDRRGLTLHDHAREHCEMLAILEALGRANACLCDAAKRSDIEGVEVALHAGAQVDHLDEDGWRPLVWAALNGALDVMALLLRHGASPSLEGAGSEHLERLLVERRGHEVSAVLDAAREDNRLLLEAAQAGDWAEAQKLLQGFGNASTRDERTLQTPLMWASRQGSLSAMKLLLQARASLERRDDQGRTALHHAVEAGHIETVSALHQYKASFKAKNYDGVALLHLAVRLDDAQLVQMLVAAECSLEQKDSDGLTPVQVAAQRGCAAAAGTLFALQADLAVADGRRRSPVAAAAAGGRGRCGSSTRRRRRRWRSP